MQFATAWGASIIALNPPNSPPFLSHGGFQRKQKKRDAAPSLAPLSRSFIAFFHTHTVFTSHTCAAKPLPHTCMNTLASCTLVHTRQHNIMMLQHTAQTRIASRTHSNETCTALGCAHHHSSSLVHAAHAHRSASHTCVHA